MVTYHELLNEGKDRLEKAGISDQSALQLLNELMQAKDRNLYMEMEDEADEAIATDYLIALHRMEKQEPLAYVLGYENFYGYRFDVNDSVLIPRPETEELVALVLSKFDEKFGDREHVTVFDVATGSGAIGITLSLEEPKMELVASDISKEALETAWNNNQKLDGRCNFIQGDMVKPFIDRDLHCDILVCNPPYIRSNAVLESSVKDYEPHVALFGGDDGLRFYKSVFEDAPAVLKPGAFMAFEIGYDEKDALLEMAKDYFPEAKAEVHQDINGKDRMLLVEF